ncbi:MAG: FtsW/RodA/SpoVE family cell cycle protein [Micromonosporaceae bacterium]|nr:FtsW/RodA/SpoVE family cell cycle protein [Micromonosporaceae bacterium]
MTAPAAHPTPPAPAGATTRRRVPTRRNSELWLIVLATALAAVFAMGAHAALLQEVRFAALVMPTMFGVLMLVAHSVVRFFAPYADPAILPCVTFLNGLGIMFIARIDLGKVDAKDRAAIAEYGTFGFRQLLWTLVAVVAFTVVLTVLRDHRALSRYAYTLAFTGLVLVLTPAVLPASLSDPYNSGAKLWIAIPGLGQIQPSEFAKLLLMVFFAYYLVRKREVLSLASKRVLGIDFPRPRDLGPVLVVWAASLLVLVGSKDLGTSLMYFGCFVAMMYVATERTSWLLIGLGLFMAGAVFAYTLFDVLQLRVSVWLDPFADPDDTGFQPIQALFGLGTGGLFGTGPGVGAADTIPVGRSDYITAGIGEEAGLFGLTAVLVLYLVIVERGLRTALMVRDSFGKLFAAGLAFSLGLQVFVIVGGVSKLIPLTGLTTPFLSYGGSSLVANWILTALLLRISDAARRPADVAPPSGKLSSALTEVIRR